jgi:hypothetical protein
VIPYALYRMAGRQQMNWKEHGRSGRSFSYCPAPAFASRDVGNTRNMWSGPHTDLNCATTEHKSEALPLVSASRLWRKSWQRSCKGKGACKMNGRITNEKKKRNGENRWRTRGTEGEGGKQNKIRGKRRTGKGGRWKEIRNAKDREFLFSVSSQ